VSKPLRTVVTPAKRQRHQRAHDEQREIAERLAKTRADLLSRRRLNSVARRMRHAANSGQSARAPVERKNKRLMATSTIASTVLAGSRAYRDNKEWIRMISVTTT